MLSVARLVCRHSGASPGDAVQQAWVKALSKPTAERPSIQNHEHFVNWMCKLAKYEAKTNRAYARRQAERELVSTEDMPEVGRLEPSVGAFEARKMLQRVFVALEPNEQALLHVLYAEQKTITEVADELQRPLTTVDSQHRRLLKMLYAAIQAGLGIVVLLVPRRAQAFVKNIAHHVSGMSLQAAHVGTAMSLTVVCGVLLPSGSSAMTEAPGVVRLTPYSTPPTNLTQGANLPPRDIPWVEPEEPKGVDPETNQCLPLDMTSTKMIRLLQETVVPAALVVAPALTQVACTGAKQQTLPAQQADDEEEEADRVQQRDESYSHMCDFERARGSQCPTREEWDKRFRHE